MLKLDTVQKKKKKMGTRSNQPISPVPNKPQEASVDVRLQLQLLQLLHQGHLGQSYRVAPVFALEIFQSSVTAIRWLTWLTETYQIFTVTGQIVTVTGQIHGRLYYC